MLKDNSTLKEAGEEIRRHENASGTWVNYLENHLQTQRLESSNKSSAFEAIDSERHQLQNQESIVPGA